MSVLLHFGSLLVILPQQNKMNGVCSDT